MYTISILILLKIYQTRHPDINANAYSAFGVLAFIIFIGVIGVLHGNVLFWVLFSGLASGFGFGDLARVGSRVNDFWAQISEIWFGSNSGHVFISFFSQF